MEEIDIIELLKRVKEGKAPKRIEINGETLVYTGNEYVDRYYKVEDVGVGWFYYKAITLDTKITILDKPIIEELDENENIDIYELARKVNQIIKYINKEEKK